MVASERRRERQGVSWEVEVRELPEAGEIEVGVTRLVADAYGPEGEHEGEGPSHEGP